MTAVLSHCNEMFLNISDSTSYENPGNAKKVDGNVEIFQTLDNNTLISQLEYKQPILAGYVAHALEITKDV